MDVRKRAYHGLDWLDLAMSLSAFETLNSCRLSVRLATGESQGGTDLLITVVAEEKEPASGGARVLGSVSVKCSAMNLVGLEAAAIQALYQLDSQLAVGEFARTLRA